ncbi:hypothetical protein LEP1GSC012_0188 [Leptospira interrogans serovar Valbuzzi str. Valbuzzi]|nr:hypothetical protein LEP1GSC012_0188 [Leptospira interrogans serovar Valbuzzi str. Valbuzzi]
MRQNLRELIRFYKQRLRACPKTLKNLHDSSLEIFNKMQ